MPICGSHIALLATCAFGWLNAENQDSVEYLGPFQRTIVSVAGTGKFADADCQSRDPTGLNLASCCDCVWTPPRG